MTEPKWAPISDATPNPSRVRLVPLSTLLQSARDWHELERWILKQASSGMCRIYWPVPWDKCVFSGPFDDDIPEDRGLKAWPIRDEKLPACWKARPEVKFVRVAGKFMQDLAETCHAYPLLFPDGLYIPGDVTADSGMLASTTYKARIRISCHSRPAPRTDSAGADVAPSYLEGTDEVPEVNRNELWIEEELCEQLAPYFQGSALSSALLASAKTGDVISYAEPHEANRANSEDGNEHRSDFNPKAISAHDAEADPYHLADRAPAVFLLYKTAQRCSTIPDYNSDSKSEARKNIANAIFGQLLTELESSGARDQRSRNIRRLFGKTRLSSALRLIDIKYDHSCGRAKQERIEWPTPLGRKVLSQHDARRESFVTDMLRLLIEGVEQWHVLSASPPSDGSTKQKALQQWLEEHGLTGSDVLKTAFAMIAWNGNVNSIPVPPKFAEPSTYRGQAV